jgi:hypothetical protein
MIAAKKEKREEMAAKTAAQAKKGKNDQKATDTKKPEQ